MIKNREEKKVKWVWRCGLYIRFNIASQIYIYGESRHPCLSGWAQTTQYGGDY